MILYKEYIETIEKDKFIKFTISFNKETIHWATSKPKEKGYCLVATPVVREGMWEKQSAFSGFYKIIYPIERQSKKRLKKAIELFEENKDTYLDFFRKKGITMVMDKTVKNCP